MKVIGLLYSPAVLLTRVWSAVRCCCFASRFLHVDGVTVNNEIPVSDIIAWKQENINHIDMKISNLRSACVVFRYP